MFSLYIDQEILYKLYNKNACKKNISDQDPWYRILLLQDKVYVNIDEKLKSIDYYNELYFEYIDKKDREGADNIRKLMDFVKLAKDQQTYVLPAQKVDINNIDDNPKSVTNDPFGIYILNINPERAQKIQTEYGVICQSGEMLDDTIVTGNGVNLSPNIGDKDYSWSKIFHNFKDIPSSALIINDRNLFLNDELVITSGGKTEARTLGLSNIERVLDNLLPKRYNGDKYHIFVCAEEIENDPTHVNFDYISQHLETIKKKILKKKGNRYEADIEFFAFKNKDKLSGGLGYDKTHNRRIVSNYYIFTFDHMIKAFEGNESTCTQAINGYRLYNTGIYDDGSDPANKMHSDFIKTFRDFLGSYIDSSDPHRQNNLKSNVRYSLNGEEKDLTKTNSFVNRLLN